jgi:hypothetical protein
MVVVVRGETAASVGGELLPASGTTMGASWICWRGGRGRRRRWVPLVGKVRRECLKGYPLASAWMKMPRS